MSDSDKIHDAWLKGGRLRQLGLMPAADPEIVAAIVPPGGDWHCLAPPGHISHLIYWAGRQVALVNPRGDVDDRMQGPIAMGLAAAPALDCALRVIFVLAEDPANLDLIQRIARAAIAIIERPAPPISETEG